MYNLLIKNGIVCNYDAEPAQCDVYIEDGVIAEVGEGIEQDFVDVIDASGRFVAPGLIDMYCGVGEPGYEHKEDIVTATRSAAKGGFTSITCLPTTEPVIDNKTVLEYINVRANALTRANIFPYGSMTKGCRGSEMAEIGQMIRAGAVAVSDGGFSVDDANLMRKILLYSSMFDIPVITMCEDKALAGRGVMNRGKVATKTGLFGIPREAEEVVVARNIILAGHCGAKLHITHVTTKGSVELVANAKRAGVSVTCDTCPHYFSLTEDIVESYNTLAKVRPPLRTWDDTERVKRGLAAGEIDVIASGHTPATIDSKNREFDKASYGISALETAFCVSYTELVRENVLTLPQLVGKMSKKPASVLGLARKGEIRPGFDGDVFIFDDKEEFGLRASEFASKAKFSPFDGRKMFGRVHYTVVNGKIVYLR